MFQPFKIKKMDSMGQGISFEEGLVTFVPKTLPGEEGTCEVYRVARGVKFSRPPMSDKITSVSPKRIVPECLHFQNCPGCQYLHTSYENEIVFKKEALCSLFKTFAGPFLIPDPIFHQASSRLGARNRLQLHYDLSSEKLGFIDKSMNSIVEVPGCRLGNPLVQTALSDLYKNWKAKARESEKTAGHVELYEKNNSVIQTWNQAYAEGGFSQVNESMNSVLISTLTKLVSPHLTGNEVILDLFGGNGNLTQNLRGARIVIVDSFVPKTSPTADREFLPLDLYSTNALMKLADKMKNQADILVLDPPRSGFKDLPIYVQTLAPRLIVYVSCHPATLCRDLKGLAESWKITSLHQIDLFPGTRHFETLVALEKVPDPNR
jgi:23S rRNA (uracil1939-C5)-methyltransferase